jgi:plasmid maintenance system antidote protein VapI
MNGETERKDGASLIAGPLEVQTFAEDTQRERLSPTALKAYLNLAKRWELSQKEAAALLGVSPKTWERIRNGQKLTLSQDQLTRVSALVGSFKGLHLLFANEMADRWPKLANRGPIFEKRSPVQTMIEGGIPTMLEVRRYIDAVRGGI